MRLEVKDPILTNEELEKIRGIASVGKGGFRSATLDITYPVKNGAAGMKAAIDATFRKELAKLPESIRPEAEKARQTPEAKRTPAQKKLLMEHPSLNVSDGSLYLYDPKAIAELNKLSEKAAALRATKPVEGFVRPLMEQPGGKTPATRVFHRGDPDQPRTIRKVTETH